MQGCCCCYSFRAVTVAAGNEHTYSTYAGESSIQLLCVPCLHMTYSFRTYHLRCPFLSPVSIERCACVLDSGEPPLLAVDHLLGVSARRGAACSCVLRNLLRPDLGGAVPIWIRTQDRELVAISLPLHNPLTRHPTTTPHLNHQPSTPLAPRLCAGPLQLPRAHFTTLGPVSPCTSLVHTSRHCHALQPARGFKIPEAVSYQQPRRVAANPDLRLRQQLLLWTTLPCHVHTRRGAWFRQLRLH